jgi:hypothetical protein
VTKLSAGVSTAPGGYATDELTLDDAGGVRAREQFRVSDERSVVEITALIKEAGLTPIFE